MAHQSPCTTRSQVISNKHSAEMSSGPDAVREKRQPLFSDPQITLHMPQRPRQYAEDISLSATSRDKSSLEKVHGNTSEIPRLTSAEFFSLSRVEEPPTLLDNIPSWRTTSVFLLYEMIKPAMSKKIFHLILHWMKKRVKQECKTVLFSLPMKVCTTNFLFSLDNDDRDVRGIPNYGQTCFLNSVLQVRHDISAFLLNVTHVILAQNFVYRKGFGIE